MANLKHFVWCDAQPGTDVDVYLNRWPQIGGGRITRLDELHVSVEMHLSISFPSRFEWSGTLEVVMPDLSPSGVCTLKVNGQETPCAYRTADCKLEMLTPAGTATLSAHDGKWTWIGIPGAIPVSLGLWPRGVLLAHEDAFAPAEPEALATA